MQLGFYSDSGATLNTYPTALGGAVQIGVTIKVGAHEKLVASQNTITVRVKEEADGTGFVHPDAQNHCDWRLSLSDAAWATPGGSNSVAQSPLTPNTSNVPVTYRVTFPWVTNAIQSVSSSAQLLGHNGKHSLSLVQVNDVATTQLAFQPVTTGPTYTRSPDPKFANVQNLVITSISPQDYFVLGAINSQTGQRSSNAPPIVINLADNDLTSPMNVEVTIRATPDPTTIVRTLRLYGVTGSRQSVQWDGKNDQGQDVDAGYYTFDIKVTQPADADAITYRSTTLQLSSEAFEFAADSEGTILLDANDLLTANITYALSEIPAANSVYVRLIGSSLVVQQTSAALSEQIHDLSDPVQLKSQVPDFTQAVAPFRVLVTASDTHDTSYRNHHNRQMLPHNKLRWTVKHKICLEYVLNNQSLSTLHEMGRDFYIAQDGLPGGEDATWSSPHQWSATSGSGAYLPQDWRNQTAHEWESNGPDGESGPTPRNSTHVANQRPSRANSTREDADTQPKLYEKERIWQDPTRTGDHNATHIGFKYAILTNNGDPTHTENGGQGRSRGGGSGGRLLFHPDGGLPGTSGCIGLETYDDAVSFDNRLQQIIQHSLPHHTNTPLFVVGPQNTNSPTELNDWVFTLRQESVP